MKQFISIGCALIVAACSNNMNTKIVEAPLPQATQKDNTQDNYFGTTVADPYRWLENDTAANTLEWVKAQNQTTFAYLNQLPQRQVIKDRLTQIWNYEKYSAPFKEGDYWYFGKTMVYKTKMFFIEPKN